MLQNDGRDCSLILNKVRIYLWPNDDEFCRNSKHAHHQVERDVLLGLYAMVGKWEAERRQAPVVQSVATRRRFLVATQRSYIQGYIYIAAQVNLPTSLYIVRIHTLVRERLKT